jgi:hypothetical protein
MRTTKLMSITLCLMAWAPFARADTFVIVSTHTSKVEAQRKAAPGRMWVLDTNWYSRLAPNLFAVVVGPFDSAVAKRELAEIKQAGVKDAVIKDAGHLRIPKASREMPIAAIVALLGYFDFEVNEGPGGEAPCVPEEPYLRVTLKQTFATRGHPDDVKIATVPIAEQGFFIIKRTGAVESRGVCLE